MFEPIHKPYYVCNLEYMDYDIAPVTAKGFNFVVYAFGTNL